jgi:hypothetical protein
MSLPPRQVLGLDDNYTLGDARSAFYNLSKAYHPDSSQNNYMSKEEKTELFQVLEAAYKEIYDQLAHKVIDTPMYNVPEYQPNIHIDQDEKIKDNDSFNSEFEKVHATENYDNPWSLSYSLKREPIDTTALAILSPDEYKTKDYYCYGINQCADFTKPSKYTDLEHLEKYSELEQPDEFSEMFTSVEDLMHHRENMEFDETIQEQERVKRELIQKIDLNRRHVQLEKDMRILNLN